MNPETLDQIDTDEFDSMDSAPISRIQHLIPASAVLLLAIVVAWLSYTREPSAAFLFPRIIGSVMLVLALWNFIRALLGMARVGDGLDVRTIVNVLPGLIVMSLLVYLAARYLGFYCASWLAFLSVYALYDPASHLSGKVWIRRLLVTTGFMAVIYGLFSMLLQVQTPRGILF